jgi:putative ABC transport system substrate-binding protein
MRRRELIILLGNTALAWPLAARAQQQPTMPIVGFLSGRSLATDKHLVVAFRQGLGESGYVEGRDVTIDYSWAQGQLDTGCRSGHTQSIGHLCRRNGSEDTSG